MNAWDLPSSLNIGGEDFLIRTDFRAILDILTVLESPEYEDDEKVLILLKILYIDFDRISEDKYLDAYQKGIEFIDMGNKNATQGPKLMDWQQDGGIIIPEVNKVLGYESRNPAKETHWWTFAGAYMGIGEGLFSNVISIRSKKSKGKKLEKYEQEFYRENKKIVDIQPKLTEEQKKYKEELLKRLGG